MCNFKSEAERCLCGYGVRNTPPDDPGLLNVICDVGSLIEGGVGERAGEVNRVEAGVWLFELA